MRTLFDALRESDPSYIPPEPAPDYMSLSGKAFARAVLNSEEFKRYIDTALKIGNIPSAVLVRLMDYGWGKPPDKLELTGKDGKPIEQVTEIRRIIVRPEPQFEVEEESRVTH